MDARSVQKGRTWSSSIPRAEKSQFISGDILFEGRVPVTGSADTRHWLSVLEGLEKQGLNGLIPEHGPAASDPQEVVRAALGYLRYTREKMGEAVEEMIPFGRNGCATRSAPGCAEGSARGRQPPPFSALRTGMARSSSRRKWSRPATALPCRATRASSTWVRRFGGC